MSKCTRCALEAGFKDLENINEKCLWRSAGTKCPDYGERPDMRSIADEKVPGNGTKILRRQMRLLAEKSHFRSANQLVEVSDAMLRIHRRLTIQPIILIFGVQIVLSAVIGLFIAVNKFFQGKR